jgi:predicted ester cyclase
MKKRILIFRLGLALLICFTGLQAIGNSQSQDPSRNSEIEQNKALVQRWIEEGFNNRDLRVVDEIFVESFAINGAMVSRENLKQSMSRRFIAFPDLHVTIEEIMAEGDKVGIWYTVQATHRGEFEGISPTGRPVKWFGFDLLHLQRGKITQARFIDDSLGLMRQLGATLSPPSMRK